MRREEAHAQEVDAELDGIATAIATPAPVAALAVLLVRPDVEPIRAAAGRAGADVLVAACARGHLLQHDSGAGFGNQVHEVRHSGSSVQAVAR